VQVVVPTAREDPVMMVHDGQYLLRSPPSPTCCCSKPPRVLSSRARARIGRSQRRRWARRLRNRGQAPKRFCADLHDDSGQAEACRCRVQRFQRLLLGARPQVRDPSDSRGQTWATIRLAGSRPVCCSCGRSRHRRIKPGSLAAGTPIVGNAQPRRVFATRRLGCAVCFGFSATSGNAGRVSSRDDGGDSEDRRQWLTLR
jgi:hypothetical protein